jgi:2-hydroxychromene-2-carboxylate isomerase
MGDVIVLQDRVQERAALRIEGARPAFYFDLACPGSYLVAERIERLLGWVDWLAVDGAAVRAGAPRELAAVRAAAQERAAALRLPLVWPERFPAAVPRALRVARHAAGSGAGPRFALAALRLAFCGGFDLEDPEVLAEVASAAGLPADPCLAAAADADCDRVLEQTAAGLRRRGVRELPAIRIEHRWLAGEAALASAVALRRDARVPAAEGPLAPLA